MVENKLSFLDKLQRNSRGKKGKLIKHEENLRWAEDVEAACLIPVEVIWGEAEWPTSRLIPLMKQGPQAYIVSWKKKLKKKLSF